MKMPFGKHQGKDLTEIPKGYLRWLRRQDWVGGWLVHAVDQVLDGKQEPQPSRDDLVHQIVKPWDGDANGWPWAGEEDE
jgi:uncharacterized protein (DUF3820 family)